MKLKEIYALAVDLGMNSDPRGREGAQKVLAAATKVYDKLEENDKPFFDRDTLINPYADTRILAGDPETEIRKMIVGVDMGTGELLLTQELNRGGAGIDLVMSHHPAGRALAALDQVMQLQPGSWANAGVPKNVAEGYLEGRSKEVAISVGAANYNRTVDTANVLGLGLICVHTPCDNLVNQYLTHFMEKEQPEIIEDVLSLLKTIPEYAIAAKNNNAPQLVSGGKNRSAGKIFVDMTGGSAPPKEYYRLLAEARVSTVLCMYANKETIEVAKEAQLNVIIAPHIASDSIGLNLFLDQLEARGITIVPVSGLIRVKRP